MLQGIDISANQGNIDWTKMTSQGVQYVWMRGAVGKVLDLKLPTYYQDAKNAGYPIGIYYVIKPISTTNWKESINPDIQVVVGGHHASMFGPKLIQDRNIDFAVIGEGELTFLELINRLCDPRPDCSHVMGLIYKNGGRISSNGPRELLCNLDVLPIADRDLMINEGFVSENNVMASRGCPFHCSYCGAQVIWKRKVRRRSVPHVVREIEYLFQRGSSRIVNFWDDSFTSDRRYTADLMAALKKFTCGPRATIASSAT